MAGRDTYHRALRITNAQTNLRIGTEGTIRLSEQYVCANFVCIRLGEFSASFTMHLRELFYPNVHDIVARIVVKVFTEFGGIFYETKTYGCACKKEKGNG